MALSSNTPPAYYMLWSNEKRGESGKLDQNSMVKGPVGALLIAAASNAFTQLFNAAKAAGFFLGSSGAYRSYNEQVKVKKAKGEMAAEPGNSVHGWGRALDICYFEKYDDQRKKGNPALGIGKYSLPVYQWLLANAYKYNIINPPWAVQGGKGPHEPWHWEYIGDNTANQKNPAVTNNSQSSPSVNYYSTHGVSNSSTTTENTSGNTQQQAGADLEKAYKEINAFLLTGTAMSEAVEDKKDGQKTKSKEEETILSVLDPEHSKDKLIVGTDSELKTKGTMGDK